MDQRPGAIPLDDFPDGGEILTLLELRMRLHNWIMNYGLEATICLEAGYNNISADIVLPEMKEPK